jgi:hypothetical protein
MTEIRLIIDRIILTDLDVTPERAEQIRGLVETSLQRLMARDSRIEALPPSDVHRLEMPAIHLAGNHGDHHLAEGLAHGIARAIGGLGRSEEQRGKHA